VTSEERNPSSVAHIENTRIKTQQRTACATGECSATRQSDEGSTTRPKALDLLLYRGFAQLRLHFRE
jgi:hypothetical protein